MPPYINNRYVYRSSVVGISNLHTEISRLVFRTGCGIRLDRFLIIMSPHRRDGGHIVLGADTVGVGVSVGVGVTLSWLQGIS